MAEKKDPVKSKTLQFSIALAVFGSLLTTLPTMRDSIPVDWYGPIIMVISIIVAVLRVITSQPVR